MRKDRGYLAALGMLGLALLWSGAVLAAPAADLDQIRNGRYDAPIDPPNWVNGNAGFQNAHYVEGWSIGYRCVMTDLPVGTPVTLVLEYDIKHSNRHAIDYLTHYQRLGDGEHLAAFGHPTETIQPTLGVPAVAGLIPTTFPIPAPTSIGSPVPGMPTSSFNALPAGERLMTLWGGTLTAIANGPQANLAAAQAAQRIEVSFTPTHATAVLSWGGHIGDRDEWGYDGSGVPLSAGGISGSPYHMRLIDWNLTNLGNQDRSLSAVAVFTPAPECHATPSDTTVCQGTTAIFTDNTSGGVPPFSWVWTKPPSVTVLSSTNTLTILNAQPADAGTYRVIVTDSASKSDTCYVDLHVSPEPVVLGGDDVVLTCDEPTAQLCATSNVMGTTFEWQLPGGGTQAGACITASATGTYIVTGTTPDGCRDTDEVEVTRNITPPTCSLSAPVPLPTCESEGNILTSTSNGAVEWAWSLLSGTGWNITGGATTGTVTYRAGTGLATFQLIVTAANGCVDTCSVTFDCESEGEEFCTYTMGGWGSGCPESQAGDLMSTQPGCMRDHYFATVFPAGVTIGTMAGFHATWNTAAAIEAFLPAGGKPGPLTGNSVNPLTTAAGVLAGQILALKLNVGFSAAGIFFDLGLQDQPSPFGSYVIPDSCGYRGMPAGMTVAEFLVVADQVLAGLSGPSPSSIAFTASCLNESFNDCFRPEPMRSGTEAEAKSLPSRFVLEQNRPNPFNPQCEISYGLPREAPVLLAIYNLRGQRVRTLVDGVEGPGYRTVQWNGLDDGGLRVGSGVYFYRLQAGDFEQTRKMILLK